MGEFVILMILFCLIIAPILWILSNVNWVGVLGYIVAAFVFAFGVYTINITGNSWVGLGYWLFAWGSKRLIDYRESILE